MLRNDDDVVWNFLIGLGGFLFVILTLTVFRGYVLTDLWGWFVVPLGAPEISLGHAVGISIIVSYLTHQAGAEGKREKEGSFTEMVVVLFLNGLLLMGFMWGMGALAHAYM